MSGSRARRSAMTKPAVASTATAPSASAGADVQAMVRPPNEVSAIRPVTATDMSAIPGTSTLGRPVARAGCSRVIAATMASTAIGTFIQNAHRHPMVVVNQPPSRAGHRREDEDTADDGHVAATLPRRDDISDDGLREHHQAAGAEALDGAGRDEDGHRAGQPANDAAGQEERERHDE